MSSRPTGSLFSLHVRRKEDQQSEQVMVITQNSQRHRLENEDPPCGISAALNVIREGVRVDQILSGGAAWLSGALLPGDVITAIDGSQVTMGRCTPEDVTGLIRGPHGTRLTLEVLPSKPEMARGVRSVSAEIVRCSPVDPAAVLRPVPRERHRRRHRHRLGEREGEREIIKRRK
uniref:PDZ domain-containing protein n=1 Tax=Cryptomonas curvata TaxID=233186 RepID=A0A7S0QD80_9CRYP